MNGFVKFDGIVALESFFEAPEVSQLGEAARFEKSSREPVLIFRGLSAHEVATVRTVAERLGGRVTESRQYQPLQF